MVTITIHRGELLQIKRIITKTKKSKNLKGRLYGLYTESRQPVVLIVCGGDKKVDEYVWEKHKLLPLGEWIVSNPNKVESRAKKAVTVILDDHGEIVSAFFEDKPAILDILEGQSAFREYKSLTDYLKKQTGLENSPIEIKEKRNETVYSEDKRPATQSRSTRDLIIDVEGQTSDVSHCSSTSQWYNTARDTFQNTYDFVRRKFTDNETAVDISRNTLTEDISFKFTHSRCSWVIEFPAEFPEGVVLLRNVSKGKEEKVFLQERAVNLSTMKNRLNREFTKMCQCNRCRNQESRV